MFKTLFEGAADANRGTLFMLRDREILGRQTIDYRRLDPKRLDAREILLARQTLPIDPR